VKTELASCPGAERLEEFLAGRLSPDEVKAIAAHLDRCESCRRTVEHAPDQVAWSAELRCVGEEVLGTPTNVGFPLGRLNELLTDYEVIAEIGRGGMGVVFRARHLKLNRIVALKILPALLGAVRPDAVARFRREAELAARLKHTNIIAVYDFGEVEGTFYYTMELVEGRSLREVLVEMAEIGTIDAVVRTRSGVSRDASGAREAKIDSGTSTSCSRLGVSANTDRTYYRRVAEWIAEVADALHEAHEQDVIHRDVKPSNLLLARDGRLMISDFGLARANGLESMTQAGSLLGTCRYMSPEQVDQTAETIDRRVDVYGLGATLYELLAFRPMYAGVDDREVLNHVLRLEPTPPHKLVRYVPHELETICLKAVEKERSARYSTAKEFADDLRRWLLGMPILAKRPGALVRVGKFVKRRRLPVALSAACVLLLVGGGAIYAAYRAQHVAAVGLRAANLAQQLELMLRDAEDKRDDGLFEQALQAADRGLQLDPGSPGLMRCKASSLMFLRRDDEAVRTLDSLLAQSPDDWRAHFQLARFLSFRLHSIEGAYSPPEIHAAPTEVSIEERQRQYQFHRDAVARLKPDSAELYCLLAHEESDPTRAIELLSNAIERDPNMEQARGDRVNRYHQVRDFQMMLVDAERLVGLRPDWAAAHGLLGVALSRLGRHAEAEQACTDAIRISPNWAVWWHNRSDVKNQTGRFSEALADSNEAIRRDETTSALFVGRARAFAGLGRTENAMSDLTQALRLRPDDVDASLERGKLLFDAGRLPEAIAECDRLIALKPGEPRAYKNRAVIFMARKEFGAAVRDLSACLRLSPSNAAAYSYRGQARIFLRQYDDAIEDFTKAIQIDPAMAGDLIARADLRMRTGRYEGAIDDLTELLNRGTVSNLVRLKRGMAYELSGATQLALSDYAQAAVDEGPVGQYSRLWQFLLARRNGDAAAALNRLAKTELTASQHLWVDHIAEFLQGRLTGPELLAAATDDPKRCEAYYYIGMRALIDDDVDGARIAFQSCLALKQDAVLERQFARARLAELESKNSARRAGTDQLRN